MRLTSEQSETILAHLHRQSSLAGDHAWSRRQYAPMHIHSPVLRSLRDVLCQVWPEHSVAFDVVFEAPADVCVDFHSDYESLGPFVYQSWSSIANRDFVSVHFNLTPDGGHLRTLDWPVLSWVHHVCIVRCGIYSAPHRLLNTLCRPLFWLFAKDHTNEARVGNVFDNMRLHSVSSGKVRTSYVVRLVRNSVYITLESLQRSASRSRASKRLTQVILPHLVLQGREGCSVEQVPWSELETIE